MKGKSHRLCSQGMSPWLFAAWAVVASLTFLLQAATTTGEAACGEPHGAEVGVETDEAIGPAFAHDPAGGQTIRDALEQGLIQAGVPQDQITDQQNPLYTFWEDRVLKALESLTPDTGGVTFAFFVTEGRCVAKYSVSLFPARHHRAVLSGRAGLSVGASGGTASRLPAGWGNIGSHGPVPTQQVLGGATKWLGEGYREIAPGVFRSADNLRQFRMTPRDLLPTHGRIGSHVHFEALDPVGGVIENLHIPLAP